MRKLALALVAAATLGLAAPSLISSASAAPAAGSTDISAQRVVKKKVVVKRGWRPGVTKRVVVKRGGWDRGRRAGWRGRTGVTKKVIVKRGNGRVVRRVTRY